MKNKTKNNSILDSHLSLIDNHFMKIFIVPTVLFFILSLQVQAENSPNEKWFQCSTDKDCVHIDYTCAGGVINKNFAKDADKYYQEINARIECVRNTPTEDQKKLPYKVFCKSNKCDVQGVNPKKPGFS